MAECRSCGKEIPEGNLYCSECEARMKADESYLDSLLSSVVSSSMEPIQERPVKKTTAEPVSPTFSMKEELIPEEEATGEAEYTPDFAEPEIEEMFPTEVIAEPEAEEMVLTEMIEEAEEEDLPATDSAAYNIFNETDDSFLDDLFAETEPEEVPVSQEDELLEDLLRTVDDAQDMDGYEFDPDELQADAASHSYMEQEETEIPVENFDTYDEELDAEAAMIGEALAEEVFSMQDESPVASDDAFYEMSDADDLMDLVGAQSFDEPVQLFDEPAYDAAETVDSGDDIMDFWNMMNVDEIESADEPNTPDMFGEFPSLMGEEDTDIPEIGPEGKSATPVQPAKKKNIFQRLFGNIREDLTPEQIEERKRIALEKFEEDEQRAADEAAQAKLSKEEKAKRKEEEAEQKKAEDEQRARKKREAKLAKEEQKRIQKDKKEQAKRALLAEIEANEGKINKFGASIIIMMFAAVLCFIVLGTGYYNYKISIEKAQFDFDLQRYDDAYNDVYGLDIKEEDLELYDKIMTVQYVNVQLLSYMRYNSLDMDAEALDSLMKGLRRYEKFIQYGAQIGVVEDLDYLKKQILQQLDEVFGVDESTAYAMLEFETQEEYSVQIYEIVSKKN